MITTDRDRDDRLLDRRLARSASCCWPATASGSSACTCRAVAARPAIGDGWERDAEPFADLCGQLDEYFAGERREFDLDARPARARSSSCGSGEALRQIPYGETESYGELAERIGHPGRARAVGRRERPQPDRDRDPVPPGDRRRRQPHRLRGGLERKRLLLDLEAPLAQLDLSSPSTR